MRCAGPFLARRVARVKVNLAPAARLLPTSALPTSIIPDARSVTTLTGSCMRDRPFKRIPVNG